MRKLVATLFSSVDGYAAGQDPDDMDWATSYQGPETLRFGLDAIRGTDLMVLGRVTYELFAAYWPTASPEVEGEYTKLMNHTPKVVFSTTLTEPLTWQNSTLNRGEVAAELPRLTQQPGRDIGIWGSVALVRSLLRLGLLDRLRLQVYPVVLGTSGTKPIFDGFDRTTLRLVGSRCSTARWCCSTTRRQRPEGAHLCRGRRDGRAAVWAERRSPGRPDGHGL